MVRLGCWKSCLCSGGGLVIIAQANKQESMTLITTVQEVIFTLLGSSQEPTMNVDRVIGFKRWKKFYLYLKISYHRTSNGRKNILMSFRVNSHNILE